MRVLMVGGTECYEHQCGSCGVWFGLPAAIYDHARKEGGYWSCPNGHSRGWKESQTPDKWDEAERKRQRLEQRLAQRDDEIKDLEKSVSAQKGQVTKLRKRAAAGSCPCCNRNFANLARHMKSKHPDFEPAISGAVADHPALKLVKEAAK